MIRINVKRKGGKQLEIRKGEMRRRNMKCKGKSTRKEKMRNFTRREKSMGKEEKK